MKKFTVLLLLTITFISFTGCKSSENEVALRPIHNIQRTTKKQTDKIVYTAKNGKQYHRSSCRHMEYTSAIKLSAAKKMGYMPCSLCKP